MTEYQYSVAERVEEYHWWSHGKRTIVDDILRSHMRKRAGHTGEMEIIDFGCGPSVAELNALKKYGNVTGTDYSELALEICRKKWDGDLVLQDLAVPIHSDKKYDVAIALDILEHIENDYMGAKNIYKSLKTGGGMRDYCSCVPVALECYR